MTCDGLPHQVSYSTSPADAWVTPRAQARAPGGATSAARRGGGRSLQVWERESERERTTAGSGGVPHCPPGAHVQTRSTSGAESQPKAWAPGLRRDRTASILHLFTIDRPALRYTCAILLTATSSTVQTANRYVTVFFLDTNYCDGFGAGPRRPRHLENRERCRGRGAAAGLWAL